MSNEQHLKLLFHPIFEQAVAAVLKEGEPAKTVLWSMAPEIMVDQKHPHGPATDIWAVGCVNVSAYTFVVLCASGDV